MADAPQPSAQQSFDAQQMDNQALQQPSAGDAAAPPARADVTVTTTNVGSQDGPSLINKTTDPKNDQGNQGGPNSGNNANGGDGGNDAGGNKSGGDAGQGRFGNGAGGDGANGFAGNLGVTAEAGGTDGATGGGGGGGAAGGVGRAAGGGGAGSAGGGTGGTGQGAPGAGGGAGGGTNAVSAAVNPASTAAAPTAATANTGAEGAATTTAPAPTASNAINNITVPTVSDNGTVTALPTGVNPTNQSSSDLVVQVDETNSAIKVEGTLISTSEFARVDGFATSLGRITIAPDGAWNYVFNDAFNSLPKGESLSDSFLLTAVDGTTTALTVTIVGTNDAPVISPIVDGKDNAGNVQEEAKLTASGQFAFTDVDVSLATATWSVVGPSDEYGSMSVDKTGKWTYTLNNSEKVNGLAADESFEKIYTITVTDEKGGSDTEDVTIILSGSNDKPIITVIDKVLGNVQEGGTLIANGQFTATDVDVLFKTAQWDIVGSATSSLTSDYGSMVVDQKGNWRYTLDASSSKVQTLAVGENVNDFFTIKVTDDKGAFDTKEFTIIIKGTHDVPVISVSTLDGGAGNVQEDVKLTSIGQFNDIYSKTAEWSIDGSRSSDYGSISVDQDGKWTYVLNNTSKVQALFADQSFEEIYTIKVIDGDTIAFQNVTIIISGNNDIPAISFIDGQVLSNVQEEGILTAIGQFIATDVDVNAMAQWSIVGSNSGDCYCVNEIVSVNSDYGSMSVDQTGKWTYTLDNTSLKVQALAANESYKDFFTIIVTDEKGAVATKDVSIMIFGANHNLIGGPSIDVISAGDGNETIIGGGGADILTGGAGADIFQYISTADLTTTPGVIEKITDFSSSDGDKVDLTSLLSSATSLANTMKIDATDGSSTHDLVSISIGGSSYLIDINNANPGVGFHYAEIDSQALLGNPTLGTQASWTDIVDVKSATGFLGDTASHGITGDGWTLKVIDSDVTHKETVVPGGTSTVEFFRGTDKVTDVNVQITTSDGVIHDVSHADKITWHG